MKNRILSIVLAVLLVVPMLSVVAFADEPAVAGEGTMTISIGTVYGKAGETVLVPVYVELAGAGAEEDHLRDFQIKFTGAALGKKTEIKLFSSDESNNCFVNAEGNYLGFSPDTGANIGTMAQLTVKGGKRVALVPFVVPADATENITLTGSLMTAQTETADAKTTFGYKTATVNAGAIIVKEETGAADPYTGTGEDYVVPAKNESGKVVTALKANTITGTIDTLYLPAEIATVEMMSMATSKWNTLVVKNPDAGSDLSTELNLNKMLGNAGSTVYCHITADGTKTTKDAVAAIVGEGNVKNILAAPQVTVKRNAVSVVGVIAVDDKQYKDVAVEIDFGEGRVISWTTTAAYKGLKGVETVGGTYYFGMNVKNVPAGKYSVTATVYGTLENGVVVVSDAYVGTITVG